MENTRPASELVSQEVMFREIVIEGPGKNALGYALMRELLDKIEGAQGAPLLLTGGGDAFSAGLNLKEIASLDVPGMEAFLRLLTQLCEALYYYPAPTVAAVNGHAIAGGAILALCCDHRVCTSLPKVRVGLNEVALGLRFPPRLLNLVRPRLPSHQLEAILLSAGLFAPTDALRLGLVDELADDCLSVARARLETLAGHPRDAYAAAKRAIRPVQPADDAAEAQFTQEVLPVWTGDALKRRIMALLKK